VNAFINAVSAISPLSEQSLTALAHLAIRQELPKGSQLVKENTVCERVYFIEKGLARTYYYKDGKDVTDWLGAEGAIVGSIVSFLTQKPGRRVVELLEPSIVWSVTFKGLELLYARYHEIERLGRMLANTGIILLQERFDHLHFSTALERYEKLLADNPSFVQRVPLGMIASYLGISQETLSRIRAQVSI
jgi:CRP-like cAMP-binding protein